MVFYRVGNTFFPSSTSLSSSSLFFRRRKPTNNRCCSNSFSVFMREYLYVYSRCVALNELLMLLNCWCRDRENNMMERQKKMKSCQAFKLINAISKRLYIILIFILFLIVSHAISSPFFPTLWLFTHTNTHIVLHMFSFPFLCFAFLTFSVLLFCCIFFWRKAGCSRDKL